MRYGFVACGNGRPGCGRHLVRRALEFCCILRLIQLLRYGAVYFRMGEKRISRTLNGSLLWRQQGLQVGDVNDPIPENKVLTGAWKLNPCI